MSPTRASTPDRPTSKDGLPVVPHKRVSEIRRDSALSNGTSVGSVVSSGQESVGFETAITKAGYGKFNLFLMIVAFPSNCSATFNTASISYVIPTISCEYNLSSFDIGLLNGATYAGMIGGSYLWGNLSDTLGRKKILVFGFFLEVAMNLLTSLSTPGSYFMLFFKFISGFMGCGLFSIFLTYLSEVFNSEHRSLALMSSGFFYSVGSIIQSFLAMTIVPSEFVWMPLENFRIQPWRLFLMICCLPSLLSGIAAIFFYESPKFLLDAGRKDDALKVFQAIYTINTGKPGSTYPVNRLRKSISLGASNKTNSISNNKTARILDRVFSQLFALFKPPYLTRTLFAFSLQFGALTSLNVVRVMLPLIFDVVSSNMDALSTSNETVSLCSVIQSKDVVEIVSNSTTSCGEAVSSAVYINMMWVYALCFIVHTGFVLIIDRVNKVLILCVVCLMASATIAAVPLVPLNYFVVLAAIYVSVLNVFFYTLTSVVVGLFPTHIRATGVSMTIMCGRLGILIGNLVVTPLIYQHCSYVFYGFCAILLAVGLTTLVAPFNSAIQEPVENTNDESKSP